MTKLLGAVVAALAVSAAPAFAADMPVKAEKAPAAAPSPWDIAFGAAVMNDYVFRGVTQSDHKPSVAAYFEPRYNITPSLQLYAGLSGESIKFANDAAAEIDFYGGVRPTFGPLALDFGIWEYYYPGGTCFGGADPGCLPALANGNVAKKNASFFEVYAKAAYTIGDFVFGPNFYYSPNFLNTGADGEYLSGTFKWTAPAKLALGDAGWYVSGEFGRQWLGTSDSFYGLPGTVFANGIPYKDYNTWNVGIGFTWKTFTLDLRYSDTNLSKGDCNAFTSDPGASGTSNVTPINPSGAGSNWCGATFIARLSADLTLGSLK
ncbi:MAG TPA: TorF family putative porin [Pseudolabrys sp.]|nr:TorF family putative porin [Pseudolabrys sp.]